MYRVFPYFNFQYSEFPLSLKNDTKIFTWNLSIIVEIEINCVGNNIEWS